MIIANPIFDEYFKRLMSHKRVAKFFIGTLLNCEVQTAQFRPQELTYIDKESKKLRLCRVDFSAVIKTANGESKNVLIEVQKAQKQTALARFRGYLGEHYRDTGDNEAEPLPIITIYIMGFNLPDIKSPCFKIGREYVDLFTGEPTEERSHFMERLTHDSYVVQAARIPEHRGRNPLNELLDLFEQRNFTNAEKTEKDYPYEPETAGVREMRKVLSGLVTDPEARKQVALELEYERIMHAGFNEMGRELTEAKMQITEAKMQIAEQATALADKNIALTAALAELETLKQQQNK
jgi:hypothetical protein